MKPSLQPRLYDDVPEACGQRVGVRPSLLIVDDQPLMAEYMASVAEDAGWAVELATTAREFEVKFMSGEPDMIALDLDMPGRDGVELMRFLSANAYGGNLMIVSACDEAIVETSAKLAREHGLAVTGYLQKPVTAQDFLAHLEQVVAMVPASALNRRHQ